MADVVLEVENISSCEDDVETDNESPAAATTRPVTSTARAGVVRVELEDTAEPISTQTASLLENLPPPSTSARSQNPPPDEAESQTTCDGNVTGGQTLGTEPRRSTTSGDRTEETLGVQGTLHPQTPAQPIREEGSQRRQSLASQTSRTVSGQREPVRRAIIEEPPPLYAHLFPNGGSCTHCTHNQHNISPPHDHTFSPTAHRHSQSMPREQCGQQCSTCYTHASCHPLHTGISLPGGIGHHSEHDHTSRYHSTVLPILHHGSQQNVQYDVDSYIKLSFVCVVLCTLHLNLPALVCVLPALAYSIMAQKMTVEGRYRKARKYSRAALTCNLMAFCQYILLLLTIAAVVAFAVIGIKISL